MAPYLLILNQDTKPIMTAFSIKDDLNWGVEPRPLFYPDGDGNFARFGSQVAVVRDDNGKCLGNVSSDYEFVQNSTLKSIVQPMVEEGLLTIENTGYLANGSKVFIQSKISQEFRVLGEDYESFFTLLNDHVGKAKVAIGSSNIRVICQNTFAMSYANIDNRFRHSEGVTERVLESRDVVDYVNNSMRLYNAQAESIAKHKCSADQFSSLIEAVYGKPVKEMRTSMVESLNSLFYNGAGNSGETFYDAFNAITDFGSNHSRKTRDGRFNYANFGSGRKANLRAMDVALEMATGSTLVLA